MPNWHDVSLLEPTAPTATAPTATAPTATAPTTTTPTTTTPTTTTPTTISKKDHSETKQDETPVEIHRAMLTRNGFETFFVRHRNVESPAYFFVYHLFVCLDEDGDVVCDDDDDAHLTNTMMRSGLINHAPEIISIMKTRSHAQSISYEPQWTDDCVDALIYVLSYYDFEAAVVHKFVVDNWEEMKTLRMSDDRRRRLIEKLVEIACFTRTLVAESMAFEPHPGACYFALRERRGFSDQSFQYVRTTKAWMIASIAETGLLTPYPPLSEIIAFFERTTRADSAMTGVPVEYLLIYVGIVADFFDALSDEDTDGPYLLSIARFILQIDHPKMIDWLFLVALCAYDGDALGGDSLAEIKAYVRCRRASMKKFVLDGLEATEDLLKHLVVAKGRGELSSRLAKLVR